MSEQRFIKGNVVPRSLTNGTRLTDDELEMVEQHVFSGFKAWYEQTHDEQGHYIGPVWKLRETIRQERG